MSRSIVEIDAQRARWARYRRRQQLHLDAGEDFAHGGLGRHIDNLDVRLLFLPSDPEADVVPLGSETLEWLRQGRIVPFQGRAPRWASVRAVSGALVLFDYYRDEMDWIRYLALHRTVASRSELAASATMSRKPGFCRSGTSSASYGWRRTCRPGWPDSGMCRPRTNEQSESLTQEGRG